MLTSCPARAEGLERRRAPHAHTRATCTDLSKKKLTHAFAPTHPRFARDEDSSACGMGPMHLAVCSAGARREGAGRRRPRTPGRATQRRRFRLLASGALAAADTRRLPTRRPRRRLRLRRWWTMPRRSSGRKDFRRQSWHSSRSHSRVERTAGSAAQSGAERANCVLIRERQHLMWLIVHKRQLITTLKSFL